MPASIAIYIFFTLNNVKEKKFLENSHNACVHLFTSLSKIHSPTENPIPVHPPKPCLKRYPEETTPGTTDTESLTDDDADIIVPMEIDDPLQIIEELNPPL